MIVNSRKLQLLELLRNEKTYQPTKFFSTLLGVSNKTIYNDIKELSELMDQFGLKIILKPRKCILLDGQTCNIEKFINQLQEKRELIVVNYSPAYRKLKISETLLLSTKRYSFEDFEDRFCVSRATIQNDIKEISNELKKNNVKISFIQNNLKLVGLENDIQHAFAQYFIHVLRSDLKNELDISSESFKQFVMSIFNPSIVSITYNLVNQVLNLTQLQIGNYYKSSLLISLIIQFLRISIGYHAEASETVTIEDFKDYESYILAIEIATSYEKETGVTFNEQDIKIVSQRLFAHRIEPTINNELLKDQYLSMIHSMIKKMSQLISIDLTQDEHLLNSLLYHIPSMIFRLKNKYIVKNPLLAQIKDQYLLLYSLSWFVLSDLEKLYEFQLSDDEVSFIVIHFQIAVDKISIPKRIVIVCEYGIATSELMVSKIQQIIPSHQNVIRSLTKDELLKSDLSQIDLIVSTVTLPDNLGIDYLKVHSFLTKDDINNILHKYSKLTIEDSRLTKSNVLSDKESTDYFNKDFVFIKKSFKDKEECLNFIIQHYEKYQIVTPGFRTSLLDREKIGNTALSSSVAIPHANPSTVLKTRLLLITLENPIRWHKNISVDFIVVLGISESNISRIRNLVAKILEIVDDENHVRNLKNSNSIDEFINQWRLLI